MIIPNIAPLSKNLTTTMANDRHQNQKVTNQGSRQKYAQWQNDQGSQKGSMPRKSKSLRTNTSQKVPYNIRGISQMFIWFTSTFQYGIAKPLYKVLRLPTMDTLSKDVLNFIFRLGNISYRKDRGCMWRGRPLLSTYGGNMKNRMNMPMLFRQTNTICY